METIINAKPRQATMTTAYEKGEQVITHPTGVVSKYTVQNLEDRKTRLLAEQKRIAEEMVRVDNDIAECGKTLIIK